MLTLMVVTEDLAMHRPKSRFIQMTAVAGFPVERVYRVRCIRMGTFDNYTLGDAPAIFRGFGYFGKVQRMIQPHHCLLS